MSTASPSVLLRAWADGDRSALIEVCTEYGDLARRFIQGLLDEPSDQVCRECLQAALSPPPPTSVDLVRAVVLQRAHRAAAARRGSARRAVNRDVFGVPMPHSLTMALLEPLEQCAWMLTEIDATAEEARHVLVQEFRVATEEADARMAAIREEVQHRLWATQQIAALHRRIDPMGKPARPGAAQRLEWMEELTEDARGQPDDPPPARRLLELVEGLGPAVEDVAPSQDVEDFCLSRAEALFAGLARYYGGRWVMGFEDPAARGRLVMLTYNSEDRAEVEALHRDLLDEARSSAGASLRIWIDWEGIRDDRDAFLLAGTVILLLARGFLISVGPRGAGRYQVHEIHAIRVLRGISTGAVKICEVGLGTLEGDLASPLVGAVADLTVDLRIPERRDRIVAILDCFR